MIVEEFTFTSKIYIACVVTRCVLVFHLVCNMLGVAVAVYSCTPDGELMHNTLYRHQE